MKENDYVVYPIYGTEVGYLFPNKAIIGVARKIKDIKIFRDNIHNYSIGRCRNFLIIDWKRYQYKKYLKHYETQWITFHSDEFWNMFRFATPVEEYEIESKGRIDNNEHFRSIDS